MYFEKAILQQESQDYISKQSPTFSILAQKSDYQQYTQNQEDEVLTYGGISNPHTYNTGGPGTSDEDND